MIPVYINRWLLYPKRIYFLVLGKYINRRLKLNNLRLTTNIDVYFSLRQHREKVYSDLQRIKSKTRKSNPKYKQLLKQEKVLIRKLRLVETEKQKKERMMREIAADE
eukprot:TRINITY_DN7044_c0_g1_i2.p1 TRINITY_DN7044_c0_g1~~TRINITY_DN7044_c0_g1_i2.p1  ORF type:complete len:107 (-),score=9.06 TRINITY_DN7044_c0_g1_i2:139-459(-)